MELATDEKLNPIKQDTRKNWLSGEKELWYYAKFPYFNYGFIPQTWEDSNQKSSEGFFGDNDPLDIVELSESPLMIGDLKSIKIFGALKLIDQNELDWKILCMNFEESERLKIRDLKDWEQAYPCKLESIKKWFETIKVYDGKARNVLESNWKVFSVQETIEII